MFQNISKMFSKLSDDETKDRKLELVMEKELQSVVNTFGIMSKKFKQQLLFLPMLSLYALVCYLKVTKGCVSTFKPSRSHFFSKTFQRFQIILSIKSVTKIQNNNVQISLETTRKSIRAKFRDP